ncbi:MAG: helix-turn-helix transcriptional regulator [Lewinellaceae bacterium]|nr:helix-turn-helix transcriptional regulator [Lewinellaceae bacterium]
MLQSAAAKRAYLDDYASSVQDDFGLSNQLVNFIHLFFFGWCILVYRAHEKRIRDFYSDLSKVRLDWLGQFLYIAFAIVVLSIFVFYARKFDWPFLSAFYPWHFLGVVAVIYWTAYRALAQPMLFTGEEASAASAGLSDAIFLFPEESAEQKKAPDDPQRKALAEKLVQIMELERLYLNSELTVQDLVNRLQANRQYISEALNLHLGKTFYDFVNDYRVEAFQRLAKDPAHGHYTILGLALEAGFNSKATFNAIFKKKVGMTPSEYIRRIKMSLN